ncbi:MAG: HAD family phosphatase [Anaerolineales bacterium]|nr:HAD family phosphatase [Anaerolineales bacterium]
MHQTPETERCKLAIFDLDGTLKAVTSPYGHVHRALGVETQANKVYQRYQRGEISYHQWGQEEISLWRGLSVVRLRKILSEIPYLPGAVEFVSRLRANGIRVALVSAGFDVHVQNCAKELDVDFAFFNQLGISSGILTGEFITNVDGHNKGALVKELQTRFGARREETLVAGDTVHDIPMFPEAAVSISVFPAEENVAQAATFSLTDNDWNNAWKLIELFKPGWLPGISDRQ